MKTERRHGILMQNILLSVISALLAVTGFFSMKYYSNMEEFARHVQEAYSLHEIRIDNAENRIGVIEATIQMPRKKKDDK